MDSSWGRCQKAVGFCILLGMADLIPLTAAAALVGKSEISIRRLITAGKVPVHKEQSADGVVYMLDPKKLRAFYVERDAAVEVETRQTERTPLKASVERTIPIKKKHKTDPVPLVVKEPAVPAYDTYVSNGSVKESHMMTIVVLMVLVVVLLMLGAYFLFA